MPAQHGSLAVEGCIGVLEFRLSLNRARFRKRPQVAKKKGLSCCPTATSDRMQRYLPAELLPPKLPPFANPWQFCLSGGRLLGQCVRQVHAVLVTPSRRLVRVTPLRGGRSAASSTAETPTARQTSG